MIKAVIIDVDDTLCLTEAACFDLENEVLQRMGRDKMSHEAHLSTWGQPLFEVIATRSPGIDIEAFKLAYHPVIDEFIADGRLDAIPDANYEALDQLVASGKQVMLLTSRTHGEFKHLLAHDHQLGSRVSAFYYKDNTAYHKPDPRAFDELLRDHSLRPEQCVYVGDTLGDATASSQAGLRFVASLESCIRQRRDFDGQVVSAFITSFPEIVNAVATLEAA